VVESAAAAGAMLERLRVYRAKGTLEKAKCDTKVLRGFYEFRFVVCILLTAKVRACSSIG
jgi:hypothetical protein